jgi:hypothetical protein
MSTTVVPSELAERVRVLAGFVPSEGFAETMRLCVALAPNQVTATWWHAVNNNAREARTLPWFQKLSVLQRFIVTLVAQQRGRTVASLTEYIQQVQESLHRGNLRRSDDIEILTALLTLFYSSDVWSSHRVQRIHALYEKLKLHHWWPSGPEDVPLGFLLATIESPSESPQRMMERLFTLLAAHYEIPGSIIEMLFLAQRYQGKINSELMAYILEQRNALILSPIIWHACDSCAVIALSCLPGTCDENAEQYVHLRSELAGLAVPDALIKTCGIAADTLVQQQVPALVSLIQASVVYETWMRHRGHLLPFPFPSE